MNRNLTVIIRLAIIFLTVTGCSSIRRDKSGYAKKFTIDKSWARHTAQREYIGARVNHVMQPVIFENLVIAGNEFDSLIAYDAHTGQPKWKRSFSGGVTASAKLNNGILYFGAGDGYFYALNAASGSTRWSFPIRSEGIGSPLLDGELIYFLTGNNAAYALKAATGEQVWYYNRLDSANLTVRGASEPSIIDNRIYFGFSDGYLVALDKNKGSVLWEKQLGLTPRFRDVDSKPVVDGDRLYVSSYDGRLYALNAFNGQTIWAHDDGGYSPVTIAGSNLYYASSTRKVLSLEKSSGKVLWSVQLSESVGSQPVLHRGLVIFGEWVGRLRALDAANGQDITSFATGRGVTSKATIDDKDNIFVMTADANLFALKLRLEDKREVWDWEK